VAVKLGTDGKNCDWIYRISANPGDAEGQRPAAHSGLGTWVGARVASPRCLILRPGCWNVPRATTALQSWARPWRVERAAKRTREQEVKPQSAEPVWVGPRGTGNAYDRSLKYYHYVLI
jgi:hypothetical protein